MPLKTKLWMTLGILLSCAQRANGQWLTEWVQYEGHRYRITEQMSWPDAEAQANSVGGHLVTINNVEENQWLVDTLLPVAPEGYYGRTFWIGLHQITGSVEPGEGWQWISGEPLTYLNWNPNEPSNGYSGEWVAHMWDDYESNNQLQGMWNDLADNSWLGTPIAGLVEVPIPEPSTALLFVTAALGTVLRRRFNS